MVTTCLTDQVHPHTFMPSFFDPIYAQRTVIYFTFISDVWYHAVVCVDKCPLVADYYSFICRYDLQAEADSDLTAGYEYVPARQCMYVIQVSLHLLYCTEVLAATE